MNRIIIAIAIVLSVVGIAGTAPHDAAAASYWANTPGWASNGWEVGSASIGGYGAGRQYQVCIQDSYGFSFSCYTGYTINNNLNRYYSLAQAYSCLPTRTWSWLSGVGTAVSPYVDLC